MNKQELVKIATDFVENSEGNIINEQIAISKEVIGMKIFDAPILGFASANDDYFQSLRNPSAVGEHFILPQEWLAQSKTVISFFLPFTKMVKEGERRKQVWPSEEFLHARIEGQALLIELSKYIQSTLINHGYKCIVPYLDERYWSVDGYNDDFDRTSINNKNVLTYTSNWSERHVAFVCGLGTFGLSKGLITKKGMAGRFGSIITDLYLSPDRRDYKDIYEYCSMCGECTRRCPVNALSMDKIKNYDICSNFLDKTAEKYKPRYGCGKCQTGLPCESSIPKHINQSKI